MDYIHDHEVCDQCLVDREFHALKAGKNEIVWYECGHIIIIKDGDVVFNFMN